MWAVLYGGITGVTSMKVWAVSYGGITGLTLHVDYAAVCRVSPLTHDCKHARDTWLWRVRVCVCVRVWHNHVAPIRYTAVVCTRWYRPPEILLGQRNYTYAIDVWGVGCIVAELFVGRPILQGGVADAKDESENDLDQYIKICQLCGTPNDETWTGFSDLPMSRFAVPKVVYENTMDDFLGPKVGLCPARC